MLPAASHKQETYLGSPYFAYPMWQTGQIRLDKSGREIVCQLTYDLTTNEVLCRFDGDVIRAITPEWFRINGAEFTRQTSNRAGADRQLYTTVLYDGPTKLLQSLSNRLVYKPLGNGYDKDQSFHGTYQTTTRYYIQKGNARPELITLSSRSLLEVLYDQADKLAPKLTEKQLTPHDVVCVLKYYDALTAIAQAEQPSLGNDAVFKQVLHNYINYPSQAWNNGVYGRVYAGFQIDQSGQITDITTLSPDNVGYGLDQEVKRTLKKLPKLRPEYAGKYVLPVAFTVTNKAEKPEPLVPVNQLPADRLAGRTVLPEYIVPIVLSRPSAGSREVWGYYK